MPSERIVALERVSKRFGSTQAVVDVTFDVRRGRCIGWLGPNGSGKTTLIRCMLGLARASAGTIHVRGHPIPAQTREALERVAAWSRSRASTRTCPAAATSGCGRASTAARCTTGSRTRSPA